jgi:hypothetical protein
MMKSDAGANVKTFASLRFRGDRLDPRRVTEILDANPTTAYRKGEIYKRSHGNEVRGRTGVWLLSSKGHVASSDLNDHLLFLAKVLSKDKVDRLHRLMRDGDIEADVGCYWHGPTKATPVIADDLRQIFAKLPAAVELDLRPA